MRRRSSSIGLFFLLMASPLCARAQANFVPRDITRGVAVPGANAVAGDYDATATLLNPAGIATLRATSLAVVGTILEEKTSLRGGGGWGVYFAQPIHLPFLQTSVGLGWQQLDSPNSWVGPPDPMNPTLTPLSENASMLTTTLASGNPRFAFGVTYAHLFWDRSPQYQGLDTVHLGMAARPSRFWSVGGTVRDVFTPAGRLASEKFERSYELDLAIRPLGDRRLELGGGAWIGEEDDHLVDARGRILLRVPRGITLFGDLDAVERHFGSPTLPSSRDWRVLAGITVDATFAGITYGALTSSKGSETYAGSSIMARFSAERYPSIVEPSHIVRIKLEGSPSDRDFLHTIFQLQEQERTRSVSGVLLVIRDYGLGWARAEELRDAIARLRARGKPVYAYVQDIGTRQYYFASACDRIYLNPGGGIRLTGAASTSTYLRGLLEKLGVTFQVVKIAEYKSFPEQFTNTGPSEPAREQTETYVRDIVSRVADRVAQDRKLSPGKVRDLIEHGPHLAPQAKTERLVDDLLYEDQIDDALRRELGRSVAIVDPPKAPARPERWAHPKIAVIYIDDSIVAGKSQDIPLWGHMTGGDTIADAIRSARESPAIRAIVLRVDSPGGGVEPSEKIAREVELTRGKKPILVSMGDVAASGGYMVSARGDRIFAEASTITGSIGIFYFKADVSGLLGKLGITTETIKMGAHADMDSPYRSWTEEEERIAFSGISYFYDRFITMVAEGRRMTKDRVNDVGRGRVWTGEMARSRGLVDQTGGIRAAVDETKRLLRMPGDAPVEIVELPKRPLNDLLQLLRFVSESDDDEKENHAGLSALIPSELRRAIAHLPPALLWGNRVMPFLPFADQLD